METISKPNDLSAPDIERIILASLINEGAEGNTEVKDRCRWELPPAAFRDSKHRALYKIIIHDERPIDLLLVWREIEKKGFTGLLDKNYLCSVVEVVTGYAHIQYYIDELMECYDNYRALTFYESQNGDRENGKEEIKVSFRRREGGSSEMAVY